MRKLRWLSVVVLLLSLIYFGLYSFNAWRHRDSEGPVIHMDTEEISVSVLDDESVLLQGVSAVDKKDGDVTGSLVIESISEFVDEHTRYVNYAAFDSNNHVTKASRKLVYTDYTPIRFSMDAPLRFAASSGTKNILGAVHAQDCLDGDLSDNIRFSPKSSIDVYSPGEYSVELMVKNSAGDEAFLPATVIIYDAANDSAAPKIALTQYIVYTSVGSSLDPEDYLQSVSWRGTEYGLTDGRGTFLRNTSDMSAEERQALSEADPTVAYDRFTIVDTVDYRTPGTYEIQYLLEDDDDHVGRVNLIIVVEE